MDVSRVKNSHRRERTIWAFGLFAVLVHAGLLLVPVTRPAAQAERQPLELRLASRPIPVQKSPEPLDSSPMEHQEPRPPIETALQNLDDTAPAESAAVTSSVEPRLPSAATLLHQSTLLTLPRPGEPQRRLGLPSHQALPRHWSEPLLPVPNTAFSDAFAPAETEVIDRWQEPGGVQRMVMRTPGGETLCGSRAPYNPMEPLIEPVMMFHRCAGGGRRTKSPLKY